MAPSVTVGILFFYKCKICKILQFKVFEKPMTNACIMQVMGSLEEGDEGWYIIN